MRSRFPKAYEYLRHFREQLLARKTAPLRQQMKDGLFYPVLGLGEYTFSPWKVVFKDLTEFFQCCVLGPEHSSIGNKPVLADYTLRLIPVATEDEAHYIAALLNSSPAAAALYFSSAGVQTQRYHAGDAEKIAIAPYAGTPIQRSLATLSKKCHKAARETRFDAVQRCEYEIDDAAAEYWKLPSIGAKRIRSALELVAGHKENRDQTTDEADDE
jgi:hypothetical protein